MSPFHSHLLFKKALSSHTGSRSRGNRLRDLTFHIPVEDTWPLPGSKVVTDISSKGLSQVQLGQGAVNSAGLRGNADWRQWVTASVPQIAAREGSFGSG